MAESYRSARSNSKYDRNWDMSLDVEKFVGENQNGRDGLNPRTCCLELESKPGHRSGGKTNYRKKKK